MGVAAVQRRHNRQRLQAGHGQRQGHHSELTTSDVDLPHGAHLVPHEFIVENTSLTLFQLIST